MKKITFFILFVLGMQFSIAKTIEDLTPEEREKVLQARYDVLFTASANAVPILQQYVDDGLEDNMTLIALGHANRYGLGIPKNIGNTVKLYTKAYENGLKGASYMIATVYAEEWKDYPKSKQWLETAIEVDPDSKGVAKHMMGIFYANGLGVRQDCTKALSYYEASQEIAASLKNLGTLYSIGCGVEKDTAKAKEYYGQACDKGDQDGCDEYKKLNMSGL